MGKTQLFIVWLLGIARMENGENPVIIEWLLGIARMENGENPVIYRMVVRYYVDGKWGKPSYL